MGDWSWPSNHATVAGALAAAPVVGGVHYLHDVTAGLALGVLVTVAMVSACGALQDRRPS